MDDKDHATNHHSLINFRPPASINRLVQLNWSWWNKSANVYSNEFVFRANSIAMEWRGISLHKSQRSRRFAACMTSEGKTSSVDFKLSRSGERINLLAANNDTKQLANELQQIVKMRSGDVNDLWMFVFIFARQIKYSSCLFFNSRCLLIEIYAIYVFAQHNFQHVLMQLMQQILY